MGDLPEPGETIDGFLIGERIHAGGMGVVHRVTRADLAFPAVMKIPRLGARERAFLASLPLTLRRGEATFVHASAEQPSAWIYVTDPARAARSLAAVDTSFTFAGHVHEPVLYYTSAADRPLPFKPVPGVAIPIAPRRRWLAIVGSVGQPRDGRTAASYAVFDDARRTLTYHRVAYDWPTAGATVRAAGLPERLAERLEHGD